MCHLYGISLYGISFPTLLLMQVHTLLLSLNKSVVVSNICLLYIVIHSYLLIAILIFVIRVIGLPLSIIKN